RIGTDRLASGGHDDVAELGIGRMSGRCEETGERACRGERGNTDLHWFELPSPHRASPHAMATSHGRTASQVEPKRAGEPTAPVAATPRHIRQSAFRPVSGLVRCADLGPDGWVAFPGAHPS